MNTQFDMPCPKLRVRGHWSGAQVSVGTASCMQDSRALLTHRTNINASRKRSTLGTQASRSTLSIPHSAAAAVFQVIN